MHKFYCYIDETGQDTEGRFFLVAVVIAEKEQRDNLERQLEKIEQSSRKGKVRWKKTSLQGRLAYLTGVLSVDSLRENLFYACYQDRKDYGHLTTLTIAQAVLYKVKEKEDYQVIVYVHKANKEERKRISAGLGRENIKKKRVRGMREGSSALIRLADALAGFLRDYEEGQTYTRDLFRRFSNRHLIVKVA